MKIIKFLLAWAFSLIASSVVFGKSNIVASLAPESPRRTAFQQGDGYRVLSVYRFTNTGDTAGEVSSVGIRKKGLVAVVAEVGNSTSNSDFNSDSSYAWVTIPSTWVIEPGKSMTVSFRGLFVYGAPEVSAELDSFGGRFDSGWLPSLDSPRAASHAVVENLPAEGVSNTSIRTRVSPDAPTIFGFVVKGDNNRGYPVLLRAVGPGLRRFGVSGAVTDPAMRLFNASREVLAENDDYSNDLQGLFASVGAFPLDRFDSAMMVWLVPGSYTVEVKGFGTGQGEAVIEAYQLPTNYGAKG